MFLFITRNNPYFNDLNKNPQSEGFQNDLDTIEIDLKNKDKRAEEETKLEDKKTESDEKSNLSEEKSSNLEEDASQAKLKADTLQAETPIIQATDQRKKKLKFYKFWIHAVNILGSVILIITAILCQIEDDEFNNHNKYIRNVGSIIVTKINNKGKNHTWDNIFNDTRLNLFDLIDNYCENVSSLCIGFYDGAKEIDNFEFLEKHKLTPEIFNYLPQMKNYRNIEIPLELNTKCKNLRIAILILTIISAFSIIANKYLLYLFEDIFIKEKLNPFYKSRYFVYLIFELIYVLIFQYPNLTGFVFYDQSDSVSILPISSILSSITIFRLLYILRILNSVLIFDSAEVNDIYDKYSERPSFIFTFKAMQRRYPFLTIFFLFFLMLITLSFCMRVYEFHYWEGQIERLEDWGYQINPLWVVFSSMMTLGYGDLYPRTHFGRVIIIIASLLGIYFIAMIMIYMTKKSVLKEGEQKSYNLITRIKLRNQLKNINAEMIHHFLLMVSLKKKYDKRKLKEKDYLVKQNFERRIITGIIENSKKLGENLKAFDFIPTKEQLHDISERIDFDIKEIKVYIDNLEKKNLYLQQYALVQRNLMRYLRRSILNMKLTFDIIDKKPNMFGTLKNVSKNEMLDEVAKVFENNKELSNNLKKELLLDKNYIANKNVKKLNLDEIGENSPGFGLNESYKMSKRDTNQKKKRNKGYRSSRRLSVEKKKKLEDIYADELGKYQVTQEIFKNHFYKLFFNLESKNNKINYMKMKKVISGMEGLNNENLENNQSDPLFI